MMRWWCCCNSDNVWCRTLCFNGRKARIICQNHLMLESERVINSSLSPQLYVYGWPNTRRSSSPDRFSKCGRPQRSGRFQLTFDQNHPLKAHTGAFVKNSLFVVTILKWWFYSHWIWQIQRQEIWRTMGELLAEMTVWALQKACTVKAYWCFPVCSFSSAIAGLLLEAGCTLEEDQVTNPWSLLGGNRAQCGVWYQPRPLWTELNIDLI